MAGPGRQRHELLELLDEQLDFLNASAQQFDSGVLHEYKRIALVLRVLLHDTGQEPFLANAVRRQGQVAVRGHPARVAGPAGRHRPDRSRLALSGMVVVRKRLGDESPARFAPMLDNDPEIPTTQRAFEPWWREPILELRSGETFCRWDFINGIANKEGGAHVDPKPTVSWVLLRDQGWDAVTSAVNAQGQIRSDRPLGPGRRPPDRI